MGLVFADNLYYNNFVFKRRYIQGYKEVILMAYVISDDCISCGTCAGECPVGAISEGDGKFEINADECLDCGSCAAACPTGAISQE